MYASRRFVFGCGHSVERILPPRRLQTRAVFRLAAVRVADPQCPSCRHRDRELALLRTARARVATVAALVEGLGAVDAADGEETPEDAESWPDQPLPARLLMPLVTTAEDTGNRKLSAWIRRMREDLERQTAGWAPATNTETETETESSSPESSSPELSPAADSSVDTSEC